MKNAGISLLLFAVALVAHTYGLNVASTYLACFAAVIGARDVP